MKRMDDKPWFAPKRVGVGAGYPIAWQGWAVLALFLLGVSADVFWLRGAWRVCGVCLLVAGFGVLAFFKTEGGWRWRP